MRDGLEEKERSRLGELSKVVFGFGDVGLERIRKFHSMNKETKLRELEILQKQFDDQMKEMEKQKQPEQRYKPKVSYLPSINGSYLVQEK